MTVALRSRVQWRWLTAQLAAIDQAVPGAVTTQSWMAFVLLVCCTAREFFD